MKPPIVVCETNPETVADAAVQWIADLVASKPGKFSVALSGGSTPKILYSRLVQTPIKNELPLERIHWFFGDERCVASDSAQSNFHMVNEVFANADIPNIHRVKTELGDPQKIALDYEAELKNYYGSDKLNLEHNLFDLTLLGIGPDGHIASLFPGTSVLRERDKWVAPVMGPDCSHILEPVVPRITLTYTALNSSAVVAFLVTGPAKREILSRWLAGDQALPCTGIEPNGSTYLFVDQAAYTLG